jgi:hypothetical protein
VPRLQLCARRFPNLYRIAHFDGSAAAVDISAAIVIAIVMAIVTVMAVSREHVEVTMGPVEVTMVPMPVSLANANAKNVADLNSDVSRDDHWLVAGAQRAGKSRHR